MTTSVQLLRRQRPSTYLHHHHPNGTRIVHTPMHIPTTTNSTCICSIVENHSFRSMTTTTATTTMNRKSIQQQLLQHLIRSQQHSSKRIQYVLLRSISTQQQQEIQQKMPLLNNGAMDASSSTDSPFMTNALLATVAVGIAGSAILFNDYNTKTSSSSSSSIEQRGSVSSSSLLSSLSSLMFSSEPKNSSYKEAQSQGQQQQQQAIQATSLALSPTNKNNGSSNSQKRIGGVTITSNPTATSTSSSPRNVMLHSRRSLRGRSLNAKYRVDWDTVLGEGAYGTVYPGRLRATGEKVAIKKISRHYTTSNTFQAETDALQRIFDNGGHPNISGLRDLYEDSTHYYLILDLVTGGEMFEHLINYGAYSEADAARLVHEIASALAFIHGVGVIHADLKPENLLLSTKNRLDGTIKMIDFGCAFVSDELVEDDYDNDDDENDNELKATTSTTNENVSNRYNSILNKKTTMKKVIRAKQSKAAASSIGTTAYWPPERFSSNDGERSKHDFNVTPAMDMWSVGVILYIMLTGVHPFDVRGVSTDAEIERTIRANPKPPLDKELVGHLSDSVIDLILQLMEPDPNKRISAYEMLQHPWVRGETALKDRIPDSDKKLSKFKDVRYNLEAGMFSVLISQGHSDLRLSEAKVGLKNNKASKSSDGSKSLVVHGDDDVEDYDEEDDSRRGSDGTTHIMQRAFSFFDAAGKGFVTSDDLERVVNERTGTKVSSNDTKEYVQTTASSGNMLSLSQFNKLFSGMRQKHYPRGHYIFHAGEKGDAMYFLSSGKVEIQTRKGQLVAILRSGDFFGEGSLLDEERLRFTSAKCSTPVDVIEIKRDDFDRYVGVSQKTRQELQLKWRARSLSYAKNLLRLQKKVKVRDFKKGDVVYKEGDLSAAMYRVDDNDGGVLEVSHGNNIVHKYLAGETFGESSLLFKRPRSSTVTCASETCRLHEMKGEDFLAVIEASPEMASSLRNMCRKRLFKKAVKAYSLQKKGGLTQDDIVAAFHDADIDGTGSLNLEEVRRIFHQMEPEFPMSEIKALLEFVDVDEDGQITLEDFKRLFRQFEDEKV